jgi:AP-1 complex subunit beta-1
VLSEKPAITTTIKSLPPALLDQLLTELSTLASVYHKPPETFVGQGRFGADAVQKRAIEEQIENARENPTAAAAAIAAVTGGKQSQNAENLLDIDFDGAAPASSQGPPDAGSSGLEGLAGTPQRVASPAAGTTGNTSSMDDMMGLFGDNGQTNGGADDMMNGFASLDMTGGSQPPPPQQQLGGGAKKNNEDILGLF